MAFVNQNAGLSNLLTIETGFDVSAELTVANGLKATITTGVNITAALSNLVLLECEIDSGLDMTGDVRINDEPNVFFELEIESGLDFEPSAFDLSIGFYVNISTGCDMLPVLSVLTPQEVALSMIVSILPASASVAGQEIKAKFLVDDVELPIKNFNLSFPSSAVGSELQVTLSRVSDRAAIEAGETFSFQIGLVSGGVTTWKDMFSGTRKTGQNFNIGWADNAPTDSLSMSSVSDLSEKLNLAPTRNLTVYDSLRVDAPIQTGDILADTSGTLYPDESLAIPGMKLYDLLQVILVTRCGFSGVRANLDNYPIRLATFEMTSGYYDGIKPHIGQFAPLIFEADGMIWLIDSTMTLPAGFPAPRTLSINRYRTLEASQETQALDGFIVQYSESDQGDYYTIRTVNSFDESGNVFDDGYTRIETIQTYRDYRNNGNPSVVIKSDLVQEVTKTFGTGMDQTGETKLTRTFDAFGRESGYTRITKALAPDLLFGGESLQEVKSEAVKLEYQPHPFEPRRQYLGKTVRRESGLIAVDEENPYFDEDFEQDFTEAHKAGNLTDAMTTRSGPIKTVVEKVTPLSRELVSSETITNDHVRKIIGRAETQVAPGDVGLNNQTSRARQVIIRTGTTGKPLGSISVGEMPLALALPLARRRLQRTTNPERASATMDGVDLYIRRGSILELEGREGSQGSVIIEALQIAGSDLGRETQRISTSLQGVKIG